MRENVSKGDRACKNCGTISRAPMYVTLEKMEREESEKEKKYLK
jgi:hypothetical protein